MMPPFNPITAACVRSLALSLERMDLTRLLTVSFVIELINDLLVEFPAAIKRNSLISAGVSVSSVAYSATAYDASGKRAFLPALNLSNRFHQFFMKRIL